MDEYAVIVFLPDMVKKRPLKWERLPSAPSPHDLWPSEKQIVELSLPSMCFCIYREWSSWTCKILFIIGFCDFTVTLVPSKVHAQANAIFLSHKGVLLLQALTRGNGAIQKIVAFENAFERLLDIITEEGNSDGGKRERPWGRLGTHSLGVVTMVSQQDMCLTTWFQPFWDTGLNSQWDRNPQQVIT